MKATVVEAASCESIVLTQDGRFCKVNGRFDIGEVIDYPSQERKSFTAKRHTGRGRRKLAALAACACLILAFVFSWYSYENLMVYATIVPDNEAQIELQLNRQNEVIRIKALDKEAESLKEKLEEDIKGEPIDKALPKAKSTIKKQEERNSSNKGVSKSKENPKEKNVEKNTEKKEKTPKSANDKTNPGSEKQENNALTKGDVK